MKLSRLTSWFLPCALTAIRAFADVHLASPFGDHMVLQREMKLPVWGTADAGEAVTVEFGGQKKHATAGNDGRWRIELEPLAASSEPRVFAVTGSSMAHPIRLDDVLVGEVWLCGGQSNMERQLGPRSGQKLLDHWEQEVAEAKHPTIRQLYVTHQLGLAQQATVAATWTVCSPETVANFTAVGYFFARDLQAKYNVPIGIIHSSWGGTPAEAWMSAEALKPFPELRETADLVAAYARDPAAAQRAYNERLTQWYQDHDPGSREKPWSAPEFDSTGWEEMKLPAKWEEAGHAGFDGLVWFRKTFDLPAEWKGGDVEVRLSAIDDFDQTWVNGTLVGSTNDWQAPRAYRVPGSVLKATGNVIAVRVLDKSDHGGIWNPKLPLEVASLDNRFAPLPLSGPWQCKFGVKLSRDIRLPVNIVGSASAPTVLFNGMIAPLVPYAIRGVAFYQGEANAGRATQYQTLFPALIADWRAQWHQGDFPFLFVQIAPHKGMPPEIRDAQYIAWLNTKNTAMVVTIDCGDPEDIHPTRKQPVSARLALAARALAYHEDIEYSGPVLESMSANNGTLVLHFSHVADGLFEKDHALMGFELAAVDGVFHAAHGEIVGADTLVVSIPDIEQPAAVRYAWANVPDGNLFNTAGLPASPFRASMKK